MFNGNINLNLYKVFYDVARYGSFSKTAQFTYSTQSAISKSIKKLENELDTQLFYRKSNGIELTEKGRELLFYVEKSYGNLLTAERILLERENLDRGKLSVGVPSNICSYYLLDNILNFHIKYPNIDINIINGSTTYLLEMLDKHKIDFIIDTSPINTNNTDIEIIKIMNTEYVFIANKNYPELDKINHLNDLEDKTIMLPIEGTSNRNNLNDVLYNNRVELNKIISIHTSELIIRAVKNNLVIGYVLKDMVTDNDIKKLNIKEELPKVDINLVYNKRFITRAPITFIKDYLNIDIDK